MTTEHVSVPREFIEELEEIAQALFERERSETPYWSRHFGEELKAAISRGTSSQHRMANDDMVNAASLAYNDSIEQTHDGFDLPWCDEDAMRAALAAILSRATPSDVRCTTCDGTGDVHRADGEWLGECTACDAKKTSAPRVVTDRCAALMTDVFLDAFEETQNYLHAIRRTLIAFATSLPAAIPPGYVVVPVEPTVEMSNAGKYAVKGSETTFERQIALAAYKAMLDAAPQAGEK